MINTHTTDVYCNCWIFFAVGVGILVLSNWVNRRRSFFVYLSFLILLVKVFIHVLNKSRTSHATKSCYFFNCFSFQKLRGKSVCDCDSCKFRLQHNYSFLRRQQNFDKISQLIWNVLSKHQINREMSNFCGLHRKPELYLQGK